MHDAQTPQCFDEMQLPGVEPAKRLVAVKYVVQLRGLLLTVTRQQHPEVLHRRAVTRVVEVHDVHHVVTDKDVARMEVAVQANVAGRPGSLVTGFDAVEDELGGTFVCLLDVGGDNAALQQEFQ